MDVKEAGLIELLLIAAAEKDDRVAENVLMGAKRKTGNDLAEHIGYIVDGWGIDL